MLRPLSDLYNPCLPNGDTPIIELFKTLFEKEDNIGAYDISLMDDCLKIDGEDMFYYDERGSFRYIVNERDAFVTCQLELIQKLFSWHFDVFGLIDKGLAIDENTLKTEE